MPFLIIKKSFINIKKSFINIRKSLTNIKKSFINIKKSVILINALFIHFGLPYSLADWVHTEIHFLTFFAVINMKSE